MVFETIEGREGRVEQDECEVDSLGDAFTDERGKGDDVCGDWGWVG